MISSVLLSMPHLLTARPAVHPTRQVHQRHPAQDQQPGPGAAGEEPREEMAQGRAGRPPRGAAAAPGSGLAAPHQGFGRWVLS